MKNLLILVLMMILLNSCNNDITQETHHTQEETPKKRFHGGDIVYLKPDSLKVVVSDTDPFNKDYNVTFTDSSRNRQTEYVYDYEIY